MAPAAATRHVAPAISGFFRSIALGGTAPQMGKGGVPRPHLDRLRLGTKVDVANGRFSTTDLSTGQRKRLALIHAWVDRRPVVVFDEWTADQDPGFRHVFHTELLPALKAEGRTLIVISHDDRYFDTADRIIRMKDGRVTEMVDLTTPRRDG